MPMAIGAPSVLSYSILVVIHCTDFTEFQGRSPRLNLIQSLMRWNW